MPGLYLPAGQRVQRGTCTARCPATSVTENRVVGAAVVGAAAHAARSTAEPAQAAQSLGSSAAGEQEVDVAAALVHLVHHDVCEATQPSARILQPAQQHAGRAEEQPRVRTPTALEAHRIAHHAAHAPATLRSDALREGGWR